MPLQPEPLRRTPNLPHPVHPAHPGHPASDARDIKVLTDLENRRDAFFYRHLGPHGPKEGMPLQPEPLHRTPNLPHPGHPDNPGHPASDARDIKVLTDLLCVLRRRIYRH